MSLLNRLVLRFVTGLVCIYSFCSAQSGELVCRYFPDDPSEVQVWLIGSKLAGSIEVEISNSSRTYVRTKNAKIDSSADAQLLWELSLVPGSYVVEAALRNAPFLSWTSPIACPPLSGFRASSLLLSPKAIQDLRKSQPVGQVVDNEVNTLRYNVLYSQPGRRQLTVRAILYRKESTAQGEIFTSLEQKAEVLTFYNKKAAFSGSFKMAHLESGTYLIEILAYEDDRLIPELERNQTFTLIWSGLSNLLENPTDALQKMHHIADSKWLTSALAKDVSQQKEALMGFWEKRNPIEPTLSMTSYFQRIQTAERLFASWKCDQARIFVLYGRAIVNSFTQDKIDYERWSYDAIGLVFLFRKKNGEFILM